MFSNTPREITKSRIVVEDMNTYLNYINFYNGKSDVFTNTYPCTQIFLDEYKRKKLDRNSIIIDKVPFDLDSDMCYNDMIKIHSYLSNIRHVINFSGRGYHVYIILKLKDNTILDVLLYQNLLIKKLNITVDPTIIGNPAHLTRIPGTYNLRRERFCISLQENELFLSHDEIKEMAKIQRLGTIYLGDDPFILEHYQSKDVLPSYPIFSGELKDIDLDIKLLIPCLTINIRTGGYIPHSERVWIAQYLSELYRRGKAPRDLDKEEFDAIVEKIVLFFKDIVSDYNERTTRQQVRHIVRNYSYSPSCSKFKALGKCIENVQCWRR